LFALVDREKNALHGIFLAVTDRRLLTSRGEV
jgi:hypothetical protein